MSAIDTDIHVNVPKVEALFPHLSAHWREYCTQSAFRGPVDTAYPKGAPTSVAPGQTATPDLDAIRAHLDAHGIEVGILNCTYAIDSIHNPDTAIAIAAATNDWLIAEWLEREPRLRASLVVPTQVPDDGAREIERVGGHPGFVQVFLPVRSRTLWGTRPNHRIYEAALKHDLAIGLNFGGAPGNAPTPSGWPSYYVEEYVGMAQICQSQIMNIIAEGVFDRFPTLRMALVECGWAWVPSWMWRMDKEWKGLKREIPWVRQPPSEYMRQHMRWTLQPVDAPGPIEFLQIVEEMGSEELIMFSTDYPHWQSEGEALSADLPAALRGKIMHENARAFYRLSSG
jgi:predicted TIM-barrel fold metal-dependent hydrolase